MRPAPSLFLLALFCLGLAGCTGAGPFQSRGAHADDLAAGWTRLTLPTETFTLRGYLREAGRSDAPLAVYIEGDGLAYLSRYRVSSDPTPDDPTALRLARRHPGGNVLYIARPCQYVATGGRIPCGPPYWTSHRLAPEAITAIDQAITAVAARVGASRVALYGYSGGGGIAALIAARRDDVERLVTVAGVLDHVAWTSHFGDAPLRGSRNPADEAERLRGLPQRHFVGADDDVVPPLVARAFARRIGPGGEVLVTVVDGADHRCCWVDRWDELVRMPPLTPAGS